MTAACSDKVDELPRQDFVVQQSVLAEPFNVSGLVMQAPLGWTEMDSTVLADHVKPMYQRTAVSPSRTPVPTKAFTDPQTGTMLIVSRYVRGLTVAERDEIVSAHRAYLDNQFATSNVREDEFRLGVYDATQFSYATDPAGAIKMFLSGPKDTYHQIDWIIPKDAYGLVLKTIESSIGSIVAPAYNPIDDNGNTKSESGNG